MPGADKNWQSGAEWAKQEAGKYIAGLPTKHIHVDTDIQLTASQQTEGQLYNDKLKTVVEDAAHPIRCPCCGKFVYGVRSGGQTYTIDIVESGGKTHKGDVPPCPVESGLGTLMTISLEHCGCSVSTEWAGAIQAEIQRRLNGYLPSTIKVFDNKQWRDKFDKLQATLTRLYKYAEGAQHYSAGLEKAAYWIVIVCDQIRRHCHGEVNLAPCPVALPPHVLEWAKVNALHQPPQQVKLPPVTGVLDVAPEDVLTIKHGDPLYLRPDGTYQNTPQNPGQKPVGTAVNPQNTGQIGMQPTSKEWKATHGPKPKGLGSGLGSVTSVGNFSDQDDWADLLQKAVDNNKKGLFDVLSGPGEYVAGAPKQPTMDLRKHLVFTDQFVLELDGKPATLTRQQLLERIQALRATQHDSSKRLAELLLQRLQQLLGVSVESVLFHNWKGKPPEIKLHGANAQEKIAYLGPQNCKVLLPNGHVVEVTPEAAGKIAKHFEANKGLVGQLVQAATKPRDTIQLLEHMADIEKQLLKFAAKGDPTVLLSLAKEFLVLWVEWIEEGKQDSLRPAQLNTVSGPTPAKPPVVTPARHEKKRRTIRRIEED